MAYLPSGRLNASISGNTSGAASLLTAGTMVLAGGNNVTLSQNGSTISFNAAGAAQASINFSASNASANLASVNFANSYNMSFGLTNGSQIFGSASFAQSAQTQSNVQAISAAGGAAATGTVVFSNANNMNFGLNGQTVTASYVGGGAGSNTIGASGGNVSGNVGTVNGSNFSYVFAGGNNITLSQSITNNSATLTIVGPTQSAQTQNIIQAAAAGGATISSGTLAFGNANNIGFGLNGNTLTASYTAGTNVFGVSGGNAVNSGTVGGSNAGMVLAGGNNITLSQTISGGSLAYVTINGPAAGGGSVNFSASNTSANLASLTFNNGNGMAFGLNNGALTASYTQSAMFDAGMLAAGNSAGTAGANTNGLYFVGGNNITLSQSTDAATGATITINGPAAGGGGGVTMSNWEPNILQNISLSNSSLGARNIFFFKLQVPGNVVASQLLQLISASPSTISNSTAAYSISLQAGIYSPSGASLSLLSSGSGSVSFTASGTSGSSNWNQVRGLSIPMNVSMTGGNYWIGVWSNTTYANVTGSMFNMLVVNNANALAYGGFINQANNNTQGVQEAVGYFSNTSAALPTLAPMSQITQSYIASNRVPYFNFKNTVW